MKTKKILRFYFSAESLERAFNNLITHRACNVESAALATAEKICAVIGEKIQLERLWAYLDGVLSEFSEEERGTLFKYACERGKSFRGDAECRAVKRAVIKFTRRARRLEEFEDCIVILKNYYCLMSGN